MGDKSQNLKQATILLQNSEIAIVDYSSIYQTEPWGKPDQDWFLNMVVRIDTLLPPKDLLAHCQWVEQEMGRERIEKWGARIIDIDILYYDNIEFIEPNLSIPHPGIAMRKFTLIALNEIIPNEIHPILQLSQKEMLEMCPDELGCELSEIQFDI